MLSYKLRNCCKDLICLFAVLADSEIILKADSVDKYFNNYYSSNSKPDAKNKKKIKEFTSLFLQNTQNVRVSFEYFV